MNKQSSLFLPATGLGKWSVWLIVAMLLLFFIGGSLSRSLYDSIPAGNTIMEDFNGRPVLALSMLAAMLSGVAAFITGLWAILKQKERALLVYASSLIGAMLLVLLAGEFIFPH
jgi:LPXTG-motif cell wall-anchored protein